MMNVRYYGTSQYMGLTMGLTMGLNLNLNLLLFAYRVRQLAYVAYVRTPNFIGMHMILHMRMLTRTLIFLPMIC